MPKTYVIFDLNGCVAFLDVAADRADARDKLAAEDDSYTLLADDDCRIRELDSDETALMKQWINNGQKTNEWPFDWRAAN